MHKANEWQQSRTDDFWTSIAPCEHVLQIYNSNTDLLDMLTGFIGGGINSGESVVVIATKPHLEALDILLAKHGIHKETLIEGDRYIPLDATKTLSEFMVDGVPDEDRFMKVVAGVIARARGTEGRGIRAFGEMVALLWAQGLHAATLQLEDLWNQFCQKEELTLFCAYPKNGFTGNLNDSLAHVCGSHTKMITGSNKPFTEILYQVIEQKSVGASRSVEQSENSSIPTFLKLDS